MRAAIVLISFLPFLYYATRDNLFHFRGRRVTPTEHVLHLAIGLSLVIVVSHAVLGNTGIMLLGLLFFVVAGGIDEYVWHRGIPEAESDLHAKEHLALLIFLVATLAVNWLDAHDWSLPKEFFDRADLRFGLREQADETAVAAADRNPWWRGVLVPCFLLPYAYFGLSDNLQHFRHRSVTWAERIVHLAIVIAVVLAASHAVSGHRAIVIAALILFAVARAYDEWVFHRHLPAEEVDMHAKTHLAFAIFLILMMSVDWIADRAT